MANGHGGPRPGSGRPRKPLAEKILAGNPGKRDLKVLEFEAPALDMPAPPEHLADIASGEGSCPGAAEIFKQTAAWLETTGCLALINPAHIEEYSVCKARWLACEAKNKSGLLARHPTTDQPIPSPYVRMALDFLGAANTAWGKIWTVVAQNSERSLNLTPHDDAMERLLAARR